ncbi:hypothetical protein [Xanthomonas graminis]|uniref:hypothetical protein n=1 Tax=Xanthomonas graminis TaxID=3390026 RepID=UPI001F42019F|nr:hypothetical protein [Xanthomonas translucens]UKE73284.1 hypothetical protein KFS85_20125 [Xanthomonas translucens pv. phleipratensis]
MKISGLRFAGLSVLAIYAAANAAKGRNAIVINIGTARFSLTLGVFAGRQFPWDGLATSANPHRRVFCTSPLRANTGHAT